MCLNGKTIKDNDPALYISNRAFRYEIEGIENNLEYLVECNPLDQATNQLNDEGFIDI